MPSAIHIRGWHLSFALPASGRSFPNPSVFRAGVGDGCPDLAGTDNGDPVFPLAFQGLITPGGCN